MRQSTRNVPSVPVSPVSPVSPNHYTYVGNNPIGFVDPTGMMETEACDEVDYCSGGGGGGYSCVGCDVGVFSGGDPILPTCTSEGCVFQITTSGTGGPSSPLPPLTNPYYGDPSIGPSGLDLTGNGGTKGSNNSWAWTFTKTFVSNFFSPGFYKQELSAGGCLAAFGEGFDKADILGAVLNGSPGIAETAIKGQAATMAARYAAGKALTTPLRSSVVRGILAGGETAAGAFAPAYLVTQEINGIVKEGSAALHGECH